MSLHPTSKAQLQIHFCVLLWGITAILGKLITLPALPLVWWRMLMVVAALALLPRVWRGLAALTPQLLLGYTVVGALVGLHWLTFYGAIKLANASVAATCIALAPVFTAVIEPWVAKRPFRPSELVFGLAVLPGVALVVGGVPDGMRAGVVVGAVSALFVAAFGSLNKRLVDHADPLTVTAVELGAGTMTLTVLAPLLPFVLPALSGPLLVLPSLHDTALLLALALLCTLLPFALALVALRRLSAYAVQLVTNLEPVYAIVFAILLLDEQKQLTALFYLGVTVILGAVFLHPLLTHVRRVRHPELLATCEAKNALE
ncbi:MULTISPECIES: DMT family transporter [Xanthomonas translucens group]|uniref:EamA family transporter n=1 Tax=Xanthomonas cerealis pv. cerealis TaxID=152263 RepID=A0A514EAA6_9XANT|nr:DMT family transporter [Xanthomonas translucens]QDI02968.1 EamA family transporter [Xanthomonas translucens pv. cerealis]UKE48355.1 EamA family transporter [Xanthomonas translucens pv. cerealis]UKE70772.1 DMT family transporter [Xanthomonas translucens pv. pistacia]